MCCNNLLKTKLLICIKEKCVVVRRKRRLVAKLVIEKIDLQIIKGSQLDKHPRYCNRSQILRKIGGGGYKALYCEMTTQFRTRIAIGSFFRSVPGESCKKSTMTDDWSIKQVNTHTLQYLFEHLHCHSFNVHIGQGSYIRI